MYFFAIAWFLFSNAKAFANQCAFPPQVEGEKWDVFWAQHYVGADLLREELEKLEFGAATVRSLVGVWDTRENRHGEYVSHLVAGPAPSAVIPLEQAQDYFKSDYLAYGEIFTACIERDSCLPYINYSMEWLGNRTLADMAFQLSLKGSTVITSAGNDRIPTDKVKRESAGDENIVLVTSLASNGHPSRFSNYADSATVAAPSDLSMRSYNFQGEAGTFGGTSGATPLVTGTLGGFTLLSGYVLQTHEILRLLKKTAIPLVHLPRSHVLGFGMLNAYKIGRVAQRLAERCGEKKECMTSLLETEELYNFDVESARLFDRERVAFDDFSACEQTTAFANLRRAAFLNPHRVEVWEEIARVKANYFQGGAEFYLNLSESLKQSEGERLESICRREERAHLAKYLKEADLGLLLSLPTCHTEALRHVAGALFEDWVLDSEKQAFGLLGRPEVNSSVLATLASATGSHIHKLEDFGALLNAIFRHHQTDSLVLVSLAQAVGKNFDKWANSREFVGKIFAHQEVDSAVLAALSTVASKNFGTFIGAVKFLYRILGHRKMGWLALNRLAGAVSVNYDKMLSSETLLQQILAHRETNASVLAVLVYAAKRHAHKMDALDQFLSEISGHPSADWSILKNVERISLELKSSH